MLPRLQARRLRKDIEPLASRHVDPERQRLPPAVRSPDEVLHDVTTPESKGGGALGRLGVGTRPQLKCVPAVLDERSKHDTREAPLLTVK
jgi:hypothetical protein